MSSVLEYNQKARSRIYREQNPFMVSQSRIGVENSDDEDYDTEGPQENHFVDPSIFLKSPGLGNSRRSSGNASSASGPNSGQRKTAMTGIFREPVTIDALCAPTDTVLRSEKVAKFVGNRQRPDN